MKLQADSRRMSQQSMTLDLGRANTPGGKRPPFTPLTGSGRAGMQGHRRGVSISEGGYSPPASAFQTTEFAQISHVPPTPESPSAGFFARSPGRDKRASGLFGRTSPSPLPGRLSPDFGGASPAEVEALRRELAAARAEIEETRHELTESNEAREASETCVKALREFIAQSNMGEAPSPPPARAPMKRETSTASGWGFKLWRSESSAPASTEAATRSMPPPAAPAPVPAASKFGGFFNPRRASFASNASSVRSGKPEPLVEDNRESDEDSTGPVSPSSEEPPRTSIALSDDARESRSLASARGDVLS
jgi:hypothetical protein